MDFRVTAIGEILYDIYPDQKRLGGAPFNFIYHIWKILGNANFISSVGDDEDGKEILKRLSEINFPINHITINKIYPTGTVNVILDKNKAPHFEMSGYNCFDYFALDAKSKKLIEEETDILYFGTFGQRNEAARRTIQSTFGKKLKYFCDLNLRHEFFTKEMVAESLTTSNVVKINTSELEMIRTYFNLSSDNNAAIRETIDEFGLDLLSVTMGSDGAVISDGRQISFYKSKPARVVDTLGAGDAFSAILCLGYLYTMELSEINKIANEFALDVCMTSGALPDNSVYERYKPIFSI
ncbi:MAG: PfkB family carbohydrate kinase [Melioribacteraceae bacterium]|nr:PfkB family carbohydrate kinase [Melioribacteraceae bacterium]